MRFFLLLLASALTAAAATVNVSSPPSVANVTTAIAAASTGDTVLFPAVGSSSWPTTITVGKAITIDLNGSTISASATLANGLFYVTGFQSSNLVRITNGTLDGVTIASNHHLLKILDGGVELTNLRVDHITFKHGDIQIEIGAGGAGGLFDHNAHYNGTSGFYPSAGTRAQADATWVSMAAGTANALFVEDSIFIHDSAWLGANENNSWFDTNNGGKLVIRYCYFLAQDGSTTVPSTNTTTGAAAGWPLQGSSISAAPGTFTSQPFGVILTHGNAAGGAADGYWEANLNTRRGQSVVEVYNCVVNAHRADFLTQFRGSANLVHDNILDTEMFNPRCVMYEEEQTQAQFNPLRTAWPAEDQVHNTFFWNNTLRLNGVTNASYVEVASDSTTFIQQDRDYWLHAPAASGGKESFTGANGGSNTDPTDGSPYTNAGNMTFSGSGANEYFGYTPYTYPHPSQGVLPGGVTAGGSLSVGGKATLQ